jgi:hypothetical protein
MYTSGFMDFLNTVDDFAEKSENVVWFRGHSNTSYKLNSGLFRLDTNDRNEFIQIEKQLYSHFLNEGILLNNGYKEWDLLYSMQHYGVRTRLLDWTSSLVVALFFASLNWKKGSSRLWMLNPVGLNERAINQKAILSPFNIEFSQLNELENSIAIYPIKNTQRINAQHGFFTVQGNSLMPLDEEFNGSLLKEGILTYIDLSIDIKEDIIKFLSQNGINYFSIYPDLEGLGKHLNKTLIKPSLLFD